MVTRKLAGSKTWVERWEVEGLTGTYTVARRPDGRYGCSCPHWKFHKAPKPDCKHIQAMFGATVEIGVEEVRTYALNTGRRFRNEDGELLAGFRTGTKSEMETPGTAKVTVGNELFSVKRKFYL